MCEKRRKPYPLKILFLPIVRLQIKGRSILRKKHEGTVFMVKRLPDTNLNVVVRVVLETDDSKLKNSVMTFYRLHPEDC